VSETRAVQLDVLADANRDSPWAGQPLCPACGFGHLHPYRVQISLSHHPGGWQGANYLTGWVAVCVGNAEANRRHAQECLDRGWAAPQVQDHPPCGFSMSMTPHRYPS
jgi:hypothetical protein